MSRQRAWAASRAIAAGIDNYRCYYCRVPTAATIEHIQARTEGGSHDVENTTLACPYCNRRKGTRDVDEFRASGDWKLSYPELPSSAEEMLREWFSYIPEQHTVFTGSTNAKLELKDDQVTIFVRAHKNDPWHYYTLGSMSSAAVITAAWDFLVRHDTPRAAGKTLPSGK